MNTPKPKVGPGNLSRLIYAKELLTELSNTAAGGDGDAFGMLVSIGANVARDVERLRLAHPKLAKKIAAPRLDWPARFLASKQENAEVLNWIESSVSPGLKPGQKPRNLGTPSVFWATALRMMLEGIRRGEVERLGWKNRTVVNGIIIRGVHESAAMCREEPQWHEEDFIHRTKRSLPALSRRTFDKWFRLAWYMLLRFSHAGVYNASQLISTGKTRMEAEIAAGRRQAEDAFTQSSARLNRSSQFRKFAVAHGVKFPEEVEREKEISTIVDHAERRRIGIVKKKFHALCEKIWFGEKSVRS